MSNVYKGIRTDNEQEIIGTLIHMPETPFYYILSEQEQKNMIMDEIKKGRVDCILHRVDEDSISLCSADENILKIDALCTTLQTGLLTRKISIEEANIKIAEIRNELFNLLK